MWPVFKICKKSTASKPESVFMKNLGPWFIIISKPLFSILHEKTYLKLKYTQGSTTYPD